MSDKDSYIRKLDAPDEVSNGLPIVLRISEGATSEGMLSEKPTLQRVSAPHFLGCAWSDVSVLCSAMSASASLGTYPTNSMKLPTWWEVNTWSAAGVR
jgi:hypothetical protein